MWHFCKVAYLNLFYHLQVQPNSPSLLYNSLLELYLHDIVHEKDSMVRLIDNRRVGKR